MVGAVVARNSSHCGACAWFVEMAVNAGMIGLALTHTDPIMVPPGMKRIFLGSNPIAFGAPGSPPVIIDMSTTHVAWGSVRLEPCWIHLGEVAGYAAALAHRRQPVGELSASILQQTLLAAGASIAFFNQSDSLLEHPRRAEWELQAAAGAWDRYTAPA